MKKLFSVALVLVMLLSCAAALADEAITLTYAEVNPVEGTVVGDVALAFKSKLEELSGGAKLSVTIHEGRNRQVRKMCEQVGLRVTRLCRISEGGLKLGNLRSGEWRELTRAEIARLKQTERRNEND